MYICITFTRHNAMPGTLVSMLSSLLVLHTAKNILPLYAILQALMLNKCKCLDLHKASSPYHQDLRYGIDSLCTAYMYWH